MLLLKKLLMDTFTVLVDINTKRSLFLTTVKTRSAIVERVFYFTRELSITPVTISNIPPTESNSTCSPNTV